MTLTNRWKHTIIVVFLILFFGILMVVISFQKAKYSAVKIMDSYVGLLRYESEYWSFGGMPGHIKPSWIFVYGEYDRYGGSVKVQVSVTGKVVQVHPSLETLEKEKEVRYQPAN